MLTNIITYIKKKTNWRFSNSRIYLAYKLRNIDAMRNSANNNFEEQVLIGTDCATTSWTEEDGSKHILKEYYKQPSTSLESFDESPEATYNSYQVEEIFYPEQDTFPYVKEEKILRYINSQGGAISVLTKFTIVGENYEKDKIVNHLTG